MNALHIQSEREAMENARRHVPEARGLCAKHAQELLKDRPAISIKRIALARIASIKVLRDGHPEYELSTSVDFEGFVNSYKKAKFFWSEGAWNLVEAVGDLTAAIIKIKP